jgi:RNA polymerase sigma-70 factor, ECF subfamily
LKPSQHISDVLTERAARRESLALAEAFQILRPALRDAIAMRLDPLLYGRIDPSDVLQETYLDANRRFDEFTAKADQIPLHVWFRLLAMQRLVDLHRQHLGAQMRTAAIEISIDRPYLPQASSIWLAEQIVDRHDSGSEVAMRAETQRMVQAALDRMDPIDREVLAMRHFEMLTNSEIASELGISMTASSNRYVRALKRLEAVLSSQHEE